jgi:hypothetical protein
VTVQELFKIIGFNTPCVYLGSRGEIILYITDVKVINNHNHYEITCILEEHRGRVISAWYWELEILSNFVLVDWFEL